MDETIGAMRREFDDKIQDLTYKNLYLENEVNEKQERLDLIDEEEENNFEEMKADYEKQLSDLRAEMDKYNKQTTEEWEKQIEALKKSQMDELKKS